MSTGIHLRLASARDRAAILELDPFAASGDLDRGRELAAAIDEARCEVALTGDDVIGYLVMEPAHFFGRDFVQLLVVRPDRRRSGVGRTLLRRAVAQARSPRVFTSTNQSNTSMKALLTTEGWTFAGQVDGLDVGDPEYFWYIDRSPES